MDVSRKGALGEDNEIIETITLRKIANEARERMMQDRLEKQMETLTAILHELRDERRRDYETFVGRDEVVTEPSLQRRRVEEIPPPIDQPYGPHPHRSTCQIPGERVDEGRDQPCSGRVLKIDGRGANIDEGELRQRLQNAEQERDQIAARDPDRAVELEGEVRRLAQVMEEIQGKRKPLSWRIMLDEESPLSAEIMGTVIPRDFRFPDLKYSERSDSLVHIERFNDMTGVHGLTPAQRCRVFPLTLEGSISPLSHGSEAATVPTQPSSASAPPIPGAATRIPTISARDDIHDSRAVQLIDQSLAYRQYTPLKVHMEELYERIEGRGLLYPPAPITKPAHRRDKSRFCKFHDTHGNTISQCRDLKIQVEDLVRNRYLDEYVDGMTPVLESPYTRDEGMERSLEYDDEEGILYLHEDALVIKAMVAAIELRRILVDTGSSVDILFKSALDDMGISDLKLERTNTSLKGFGGGRLTPMGINELPITVGSKPFERIVMLYFVVVEERSPYQMILGRPFIRISQCVISTHYLALKYRVNGVVGVVKGVQKMTRSCYATAAKETLQVTSLDNRGDSKKGRQEPVEKLDEVFVNKSNPSRMVKIGSGLGETIKGELVKYLQSYADIFAWSHEDMPRIDHGIAYHKLAIRKGAMPVRQKRRCFNQERYEAINAEVEQLLKAGFIRKTKYSEWISNVILVKKASRMCVDFTDLNKACPKDSFPLQKIDQLVDSTAGHSLLSFMDTFSGYNQIPMDEQDEESTTFITNIGLFCYRVMPFGLKNTGATYQRLVNKIFKPLIGHTMEVYVDDMITKSKKPKDHVKHLEETFELLRKYEMKLNPEKCAFGVSSGKFLGFLVSHRRIKVNPAKIRAVTEIKSLRTVKEAHPIVVMTDQSLRQTLQKPDASGRLVKWSVELSEFDLSYRPRGVIKTQALADFMVDCVELGEEVHEEQPVEQENPKEVWLAMVDGSHSEQGSGA
ncbi:hypothetical protein KPL70_027331 [Citrus sinensis]|nr:hypothetical protein KPL70_027331 [Citrus sinensis]